MKRQMAFLGILLWIACSLQAQIISKDTIADLKFRHIGPVGNRIIAVAGIPGDPMTYLVGSASGGIWKTKDGGLSWKPVFDDKPVHAIGVLALCNGDPQVVYAGTGESFIRSNVSIRNGIYKSTDGGETWKHMGLDETGRISRIVVHPTNPNIVFAAAVGHAYSPQESKGVYKSIDGGETWRKVLFVDENTGCSDIVMDPSNPRILFAGMWHLELKTWIRISGGPGSGLYKSTDAGETWKKLEKGLPQSPIGKIALAMTPSKPDRVYALIETGDGVPYQGKPTSSGELWRSDDKGISWKLVNSNRDLGGRQAYYTRCAASPDNPNEIYFMSAAYSTSIDGGLTVSAPTFGQAPNWDHHEMWIDPTNGNRQIVVGDGGLSISQNRGKSWYRVQLPNAQLYHVTTDTDVPYNVLTNRQDGPAMKGPSRSGVGGFLGTGRIPSGMWRDIGGGESGFATADPTNPDIVWSSASGFGPVGGIVTRYNEQNKQYRQTEVWPERTSGHPAENLKYRFQWTFPLLISPHDHNTIYVTSQHVHRTNDQGQSWEVISPDLSLNDKTKQKFSGGLTGDNISVEYMNVIYAFDESPVQEGVFWAGTNDGLVHISRDGGANWSDVTKNIPDLPELGVVRNIDASKWDAGKAYLTIEFHQVGNFKPYVYKTENYGRTWTKIIDGIDDMILSYTRCIREDPNRPGLLYLGTENKLYISFNDGGKWQPFMSNLPAAPMYWIDIQEDFNDLVLGTYGRGIWILDDLSPIQQMTEEVASSKAHLFKPKKTYRLQQTSMIMQFFPEPHWGSDPPYGTSINYWLTKKQDSVKLEFANSEGVIVRTVHTKGKPGINRFWWNLRTDKTKQIVMQTKPAYADWVPLGEKRKRNASIPPFDVLLPPGTYTVTMTVEDHTNSQSVEIVKDPNSDGTIEDIMLQHVLMMNMHEDMDTLASMINNIERIRRQLYDLQGMLSELPTKRHIVKEIKVLDTSLLEVESKMIQLKVTGTGQDQIRFPALLAGQLSYLATTAASADFRPADAHMEVYAILKDRLNKYGAELQTILTEQVAGFNDMLQVEKVSGLITEP